MYRKLLLPTLAVVALVMIVPSIATATAVPDLPSNAHQAYIADGGGNPEGGTFTLSGAISINGAHTLSCSSTDMTIDFFDDGTSAVTGYSATSCVIAGFPSCTVTTSATSLGWGDRFGYDTSVGAFRDYINVSFDITFSQGLPTCPYPAGTYPKTGTLSPTISISGGVLTATFGSGSGGLSGPLGTETWGGSLSSTSGIGSDTQLVF